MKKIPVSFGFDDSCLSTYAEAFPILRENGLVGCISVVTDFVGLENRYTWENIREMADQGWEIVSHTRTHDMWDLTPEKIRHEIVESRRILNEHGYPALVFITPGGPWQSKQPEQFLPGSLLEQAVRRTYEGFINGEEHPVKLPADPYRIGRFGCECYDMEQYNRTVPEIVTEIDKAVGEGSWCHLGWHDVRGRHVETFSRVVKHLRRYLEKGTMVPATVSQAAGLENVPA